MKITAISARALAGIGLACVLALSACSSTSSPAVSSVASSAASGSAAAADGTPVAAPISGPSSSPDSSSPVAETTQASLSTLPPRTTPVPAPSGGNITQTVKSSVVTTASPVPLTAAAQLGAGISARVLTAKRVNAVAHLAGEVSGPAVAVTLSITNSSSKSADLSGVVVTVADHAGLPASPISQNNSNPLLGSLAAGKSASGVYVFSLPTGSSNPLTISVTFSTTAPVVLFIGD